MRVVRRMNGLSESESDAVWEQIDRAFLDTTTYSRQSEEAIDAAVDQIANERVRAALEAAAVEIEAALVSGAPILNRRYRHAARIVRAAMPT